jgi:hypothetical protein
MNEVQLKPRQRLSSTVSLKALTCYVTTVTVFLSIGPFFAWSSFAGGIGVMVYKILQILALGLLAAQLPWRRMPLPRLMGGLSMVGIFLFLCFFTGVKSGTTHPLLIGNVIIYAFYALNIMTDRDVLVRSFEILRTIFAAVLAYTLVIHLLLLVGLPIPYTVLQSGEAGRAALGNQYYQNYFGCLLIKQNGRELYRFTSVFTEPGVVGTFSAFFLAASGCNPKKSKKDLLFLISGIFSLSVAFYVMLVVIIALKALRKGGYKLFAALAAIVVVYFTFININLSNPLMREVQTRLTITESGLAGDNRISEGAEATYQAFLNSDMKTVLLGYGAPDAQKDVEAWQKTASYKESVYWLGVLGYGALIAWFILTPLSAYKTKDKQRNRAMYAYMAIFILSQYQRPYMKALFLVYILLAGCLYARECALKDGEGQA